jgi:hypothetical protein
MNYRGAMTSDSMNCMGAIPSSVLMKNCRGDLKSSDIIYLMNCRGGHAYVRKIKLRNTISYSYNIIKIYIFFYKF